MSMSTATRTLSPQLSSKKLQYLQLLDDLAYLMRKRKDPMRARAYAQARETVDAMPDDEVTSPAALKGKPGIGPAIYQKLVTFTETGTLPLLEEGAEDLKTKRAMDLFMQIYGVGEKKAEELVQKGVTTLEELASRQYELLNDKQQIGLKYYHDILERIPRAEIDEYKSIFQETAPSDVQLEIVGSYRRGAATSGDIDVILTSEHPAHFQTFVNGLKSRKIIEEILSCGNAKCLVVARLAPGRTARRVDFLYTSPREYPFALLYFTGNKGFNTTMREHALKLSYSLNEHEMSNMEGRKKSGPVQAAFANEEDIFAFLQLEYKSPSERTGSDAIRPLNAAAAAATEPVPAVKKPRITKKKAPKPEAAPVPVPVPSPIPTLIPSPTPAPAPVPVSEPAPLENRVFVTVAPEEPAVAKKPRVTKKKAPKPDAEATTSLLPPPPAAAKKPRVTKKKAQAPDPAPQPTQTLDPVKDMTEANANANAHILEFQKEGVKTLGQRSKSELADMITYANHAFHTAGEPVMTDAEYDILARYTEETYPSVSKVVGAIPVEKNKVRLPYEMASMDKIKPDTGALVQWKHKYPGPYVISSKLDGVSGLYTRGGAAEGGKLYTRGDGKIGQDISYLIPHLRLPSQVHEVAVRGEFVFSKSVFSAKYAQTYANARNLVAGIVNGKSVDDRIHDVDFVAYEVIRPEGLSPSQQMSWLASHGFATVQHRTVAPDELTNEQLSEQLQHTRTHEAYDTDGLIVSDDRVYSRTSGNPDHSFAFKMVLSEQAAETHVVDVEWAASKDGYLKPTIHVEPITVGGVTIRKTTGFNADFINKHNIGIGAIVRIIRSGDVIPYVQSVVQPATHPKMPSVPYVWNKSHIDVLLENTEDDVNVRKKRIVAFFKTLDVEGLREGNVQKIVAAGFDTICSIVKMTEADMLKVEGFKQKTAGKLVTGIREAVAKAPVSALMVASGTMGRGLGEKKIEGVFQEYPNWWEPQERNVERLTKIKGMSRTTAEDMVSRLPAFLAFLEECGISPPPPPEAAPSHPPAPVPVPDHPLANKTLVMTGVRSKELEERLKPLGVKFGAAVNKQTFAVIVAAHPDSGVRLSGKMKDAQERNIPMYTLDEFNAKYLS